ncbi:AAA family ATPase [Methanosarcina sp. Z-7115]|uniref:AAA family ATPase n=1 Tax=Methanosarcina baikalica TaxID=3073890 RepID=A0ABU2D1F7_9EURY|nr:AAA family ATPase [Methanosarcina sp. Z-7115]MDR7665825.1 AAA family ATPase [Methanosarcina sp. Z-7115]
MSSINCEDLAEFAKSQGHKPNSYLNGNRQTPVLTEEFYKNSPEHLQEELARIGMLIRLFLEKTQSEAGKDRPNFPGMFISEAEANSILQAVCCGSVACQEQGLESEEINALKRTISRKKAESLKRGIELRLHTLSELFSLTPFETDVLLIALAPELDGRFAKLYTYLQNDLAKKQLSVGMILDLLCAGLEEKLEAREHFSPSAPLLRNRLISLVGDGADANPPLLSRFVKLDERIAAFLLNSDETDPKIARFSTLVKPVRSFDDLIVPDDQKNCLLEAIKRTIEENARLMFFFYGPSGTGKKLAAEACCKEFKVNLLLADAGAFPKGWESEALSLILREALLQHGAVFLENFDALWGRGAQGQDLDSGLSSIVPGYGTYGSGFSVSDFSRSGFSGSGLSSLVRALDSFRGPVFLSAGQLWEPGSVLKNNTFISCAFPLLAFAERKQLWKLFLQNFENSVGEAELENLAARFKLSGGQIRDAVSTAQGFVASRGQDKAVLTTEDLYRACRNRSSLKLNSLARKINPRRKWRDIVLAAAVKEQLEEICAFVRHKETVYSEWGFDKKLSLGKGLNILFAGPSGTGKTLAAEIIAGEVGLDLYKIDISGIVSKYIGETEKNLKKIFGEAEIGNAILFFDEADALFGKRSEVNDSHDRYANIEVNYLLQQMEEHEGIIILASNYKKNLDDAFLRRLQFAVEFPIPDEASRKEIWIGMFPEKVRIGEDVDFNFLSKFKLTGGNIKNIVLLAAVLAADGSGVIGMKEILRALKREFQKMGKICTPGDFGAYYELVK